MNNILFTIQPFIDHNCNQYIMFYDKTKSNKDNKSCIDTLFICPN